MTSFKNCFQQQNIRDRNFRMAVPKPETKVWPLFTTYGGSGMLFLCKFEIALGGRDMDLDHNFLHYETEGAWVCLQNCMPSSFTDRSPILHTICSKIVFEKHEDYAMFTLMGFGE